MDTSIFNERLHKALKERDMKVISKLLPPQHLNKEGYRIATTGSAEDVKNAFIINALAKKLVRDTGDRKLINTFVFRSPYVGVGMFIHSRPEVIKYLLAEDIDLSGEDALASNLAEKGDFDTLIPIIQKYPELIESAFHGVIVGGNVGSLEYLLSSYDVDLEQLVSDIVDNYGGLESQEMIDYLNRLLPGVELSLI